MKRKNGDDDVFGFGQLIGILKKNPKKIVFTEGEDPRILEASSRLLASYFLHPILSVMRNVSRMLQRKVDLTFAVQRSLIRRS